MTLKISPSLGYPIVDLDAHYYEPDDAFTRHIERRWRDAAVHVIREPGEHGDALGRTGRVYIGEKPAVFKRYLSADSVMPPGSLRVGQVRGEQQPVSAFDCPAFMHRDPRLEVMDEQGVEAAVLMPGLFSNVEWEMWDFYHDVEMYYANLRSFNRWIEDDWGYQYQDRIFAPPMMSFLDLDHAVAELDRVLAIGTRAIHLRPGPAFGRSPADPHFDPFWSRVADADLPVFYHPCGDFGYNSRVSVLWGQAPCVSSDQQTPLQSYLGHVDRPIMDTMAALILGGLFERHPTLQIVSVENGHTWVRQLLRDIDHAAFSSFGAQRRGSSSGLERPSDVFREHVYVAPFWDDDSTDLRELLGAERVILGSDWPHPEGQPEPSDFAEYSLKNFGPSEIRTIMRDNGARLLKLSTAE